MEVSTNGGTPQWLAVMENPIEMDDLGVLLFQKTSIYCSKLQDLADPARNETESMPLDETAPVLQPLDILNIPKFSMETWNLKSYHFIPFPCFHFGEACLVGCPVFFKNNPSVLQDFSLQL